MPRNRPEIRITRIPYEEPHHLCLLLEASNGRMCGVLEYYCNASDLQMLGEKLADFTGDIKDTILYELGSERRPDRFAYFLHFLIKPLDSSGHCVFHIRLNNNQSFPNAELSEFSMKVDVADVNRLGKLLIEFGKLQRRVLEWTITDGKLLTSADDPD